MADIARSLPLRPDPLRPDPLRSGAAGADPLAPRRLVLTRRQRWGLLAAVVAVLALALLVVGLAAGWWELTGQDKRFIATVLNGLTLGALYFLVASGFTLVFGLMRNVNLAHGSLYLAGAYLGWSAADLTGSWLFGVAFGFVTMALAGLALQLLVFRRMEGQDLRQTLVTIGISIVLADLMLWQWGGQTYQFIAPDWIDGTVRLPLVGMGYSSYRLILLLAAVVIGIALWLFLNKTRVGTMIRAGVDDRDMLSASGVNVQLVFCVVFAVGAGLAGFAGVVGGTALSVAPGEDVRYLLASLVVVIVGGMGSVTGAAVGAVLIGLAEQLGLVYSPTYGVVYTFLIMVAVLVWRPQGLLGRAA